MVQNIWSSQNSMTVFVCRRSFDPDNVLMFFVNERMRMTRNRILQQRAKSDVRKQYHCSPQAISGMFMNRNKTHQVGPLLTMTVGNWMNVNFFGWKTCWPQNLDCREIFNLYGVDGCIFAQSMMFKTCNLRRSRSVKVQKENQLVHIIHLPSGSHQGSQWQLICHRGCPYKHTNGYWIAKGFLLNGQRTLS